MNLEPEAPGGPAARRAMLRAIEPTRESARLHRRTLLSILAAEAEYREKDEPLDDSSSGADYFENLYWCAFLLYLAGDVTDAPVLWRAKRINMDTNAGLDGQYLVGAGVELTIRFLKDSKEKEAAAHLERMRKDGDLDDLHEWERYKARYFYSE